MNTKEKIIFGIIVILWSITFYSYAEQTAGMKSEFWPLLFLIPLLIVVGYFMYKTVQSKTLLNSGGSLSFFNYYGANPVYLQIIEDNKFYAWDGFVDVNSITVYDWTGIHNLNIIASDDPNIGNPSTTIYFNLSYSVTGSNTILIILNADGSFYEQLNEL